MYNFAVFIRNSFFFIIFLESEVIKFYRVRMKRGCYIGLYYCLMFMCLASNFQLNQAQICGILFYLCQFPRYIILFVIDDFKK